MMTVVTRIAASGKGTMKIKRKRQRSNLRCMKNNATSSAFQMARMSSRISFVLRPTGSSNVRGAPALDITNRYTDIRLSPERQRVLAVAVRDEDRRASDQV